MRIFDFRNLIFALALGTTFGAPIRVSAGEAVNFDSAAYRVGQLQQRLAHERGEIAKPQPGTAIGGYLYKPEGPGPFPAVVLLHGCSGLRPGADDRLGAERVTAWGYVALVVDSFAARGLDEACIPPVPARRADAMGALLFLSKLPFVDPDRVAVVGFSQGGAVALQVASNDPSDLFEIPDELKFRAAVAFYPACGDVSDQLAIPALILIGELDDWSRAIDCERFMARLAGKEAPAKLVVYPGAYHAFDVSALTDGKRLLGHLLKYDAAAAERSAAEMHDFLAVQLSSP